MKTLIRKNYILDGGIYTNSMDEIVIFDNMRIIGATNLDLVNIPTLDEVQTMITTQQDNPFDVKYQSFVTDSTLLPTAELLNEGYFSLGLPVTRLSDKAELLLINTPTAPNMVKADDKDGIMYTVQSTGVYQVAG